MAQEAYRLPDFDPTSYRQVPFRELGSITLMPEMTVTNVGAFRDLDVIQRAATVGSFHEITPPSPAGARLAEKHADNALALLVPALSSDLRPPDFNGSIAAGTVHNLPVDMRRLSDLTGVEPKKILRAVSLYVTGALATTATRKGVSDPFELEVMLVIPRVGTPVRRLEPMDSFKRAIKWFAQTKNISQKVGELSDTVVPGAEQRAIRSKRRRLPE